MNKTIIVTVRNKIASANKTEYVCGNDDFVVAFDFDRDWDEYDVKTARFKHNGTHTDVVFSGNSCNVPRISNTNSIKVGVFAGDLSTTTSATILARKSILCGSSVPAAPSDDVYNQIMDAVNDIAKKANEMSEGVAEIYTGDGDMPEGCKLKLVPNDTHNEERVNLNMFLDTPIVGVVENNVVTLSGTLEKGTYNIRYMMDGKEYDLGEMVVE